MDSKDKIKIDELIDKINELNYQYYTLDEPIVSDGEYDKLYDELRELENSTGYINAFSPTQRVGGTILDSLKSTFILQDYIPKTNLKI